MPAENIREYLNGGRACLGTRPVRAKEGPTSPCSREAISEDSPSKLRSADGKKTHTAAGLMATLAATVTPGDILKAMRLVYRQLTRSGYGHHDADEMTGEVMLILVDSYLTPGSFDPARGQLSTLACRVAALHSLGRARRANSRPKLVQLSSDPPIASDRPDWEGELDRPVLSNELRRAVNRLPPDQAYVIECRYNRGLSYREIAGRMGKSEGHARTLKRRAAAKLRCDPGLGRLV